MLIRANSGFAPFAQGVTAARMQTPVSATPPDAVDHWAPTPIVIDQEFSFMPWLLLLGAFALLLWWFFEREREERAYEFAELRDELDEIEEFEEFEHGAEPETEGAE